MLSMFHLLITTTEYVYPLAKLNYDLEFSLNYSEPNQLNFLLNLKANQDHSNHRYFHHAKYVLLLIHLQEQLDYNYLSHSIDN